MRNPSFPSQQPVVEEPPKAENAADQPKDDVLLSVPLHGTTQSEGVVQAVAEQGLKGNENGDGVEFNKDSVFEFPDADNFIKPEAGSISLDISPQWNGTDPGDNAFVELKTPEMWQGRMSLWRNGTYLRFMWLDDNGLENGVGVDISKWAAGERHSVAASWGDALMALYVDGELAGQTTYSGQFSVPPGMPLFLGSNPLNHVPGAGATLSNFKAYGHPLNPEAVGAQ